LIENFQTEIIYTKIINKSGKSIRTTQGVRTSNGDISPRARLVSQVVDLLLPKLQTNNVLKITDLETDSSVPQLLPLNQLMQMAPHQSHFLYQYVRNALYDMKQSNIDDFNKIKAKIIKAYPEMSDMDIEFDPKRAQVQIYFKTASNDIKIPLESEGWGIREFFYLFLSLLYFPDTIILKDEALTHMHKSLLSNFIAAIDGLPYQMITTSHIKELIKILDFGNIIICRKYDGKMTAKNLMQSGEVDRVLDELGYPIDTVPEIDSLV
jgi:AAA15 family ATPase/GTPase